VYSKTKQLFALHIFIWHKTRQTDYIQLYSAIIFSVSYPVLEGFKHYSHTDGGSFTFFITVQLSPIIQ